MSTTTWIHVGNASAPHTTPAAIRAPSLGRRRLNAVAHSTTPTIATITYPQAGSCSSSREMNSVMRRRHTPHSQKKPARQPVASRKSARDRPRAIRPEACTYRSEAIGAPPSTLISTTSFARRPAEMTARSPLEVRAVCPRSSGEPRYALAAVGLEPTRTASWRLRTPHRPWVRRSVLFRAREVRRGPREFLSVTDEKPTRTRVVRTNRCALRKMPAPSIRRLASHTGSCSA